MQYRKNKWADSALRNEISQYVSSTTQNDGKKRISLSYPHGLATFLEMIQKKNYVSTTEFLSSDELYNYCIHTNGQKKNNLSAEFSKRMAVLD